MLTLYLPVAINNKKENVYFYFLQSFSSQKSLALLIYHYENTCEFGGHTSIVVSNFESLINHLVNLTIIII